MDDVSTFIIYLSDKGRMSLADRLPGQNKKLANSKTIYPADGDEFILPSKLPLGSRELEIVDYICKSLSLCSPEEVRAVNRKISGHGLKILVGKIEWVEP